MTTMSSSVEVYIDEHGRPDAVHVTLDVNGKPVMIEFSPDAVTFFALFPEDADTVNDYHQQIDHVLLPSKPPQARKESDE
jgi:hypothetical protein